MHGSAPDIAGKGMANPIGADAGRGDDARPPRRARRGHAGCATRSRA
ncbi:MAG: isocitrate/isopropylmalate family dehydrogenase [Ignavibacteriales bacterium]|nr:isocitrate/isopropylmalate family dehydrogenase [Ignavibacteriales bacterium]